MPKGTAPAAGGKKQQQQQQPKADASAATPTVKGQPPAAKSEEEFFEGSMGQRRASQPAPSPAAAMKQNLASTQPANFGNHTSGRGSGGPSPSVNPLTQSQRARFAEVPLVPARQTRAIIGMREQMSSSSEVWGSESNA